jgi:2-dehydro-3-deoxyphosphogluconate aldolase / (4S)-4-hydroxy-2-oxoglutarate aldolase
VTPALLDALKASPIPATPGAQTTSEVMTLHEAGFDVVKFFPAEQCGGVDTLKALAGPIRDVLFVPTGGIDADDVGRYLDLPNVLAVGGSWVAPSKLIAEERWEDIARKAARVSAL